MVLYLLSMSLNKTWKTSPCVYLLFGKRHDLSLYDHTVYACPLGQTCDFRLQLPEALIKQKSVKVNGQLLVVNILGKKLYIAF